MPESAAHAPSDDDQAWPPIADAPALADGAAHVWLANLDHLALTHPTLTNTLSEDERQRADSFARSSDRRRFMVARGLLRVLLSAYLRVTPQEIRLRTGAHGKPDVASPLTPVTFNVSHAGARILFACTSGREVGVDIERIEEDGAETDLPAADFFSVAERAALDALPGRERVAAFYRCWTRKEAYLKAIGAGLSAPLNTFTVPLTLITRGQPHVLAESSAPGARQWEMHDLPPIEGYAAALALAHTPHAATRIECMRYDTQAR